MNPTQLDKTLSDLLSHCIRCGFCLESCPTFSISGDEREGPRGRIYLIRSAQEGVISWQDAKPHLDHCLGCRACETACPSNVQYGSILEIARSKLPESGQDRRRHAFVRRLSSPASVRLMTKLLKLIPRSLAGSITGWLIESSGQPITLPVAQARKSRVATPRGSTQRGSVALLGGCVMDSMFPNVQQATEQLLNRLGYEVIWVRDRCCGSLARHDGQLELASQLTNQMVSAIPDGVPLVINSAGCGSHLKHAAETFDRPLAIYDISEFLFQNGILDILTRAKAPGFAVTMHEACHLAHGQRIRNEPLALLQAIPNLSLVELEEATTCCGSAGTYSLFQKSIANQLLDRKVAAITTSGAKIVVLGNPGCHSWIETRAAESEFKVLHLVEFLESCLDGSFDH